MRTLLLFLLTFPALGQTIAITLPFGGFYRPDSFVLAHVTLTAPSPTDGTLHIAYPDGSGDILKLRHRLPASPTPTTYPILLPATSGLREAVFVYRDTHTLRRITSALLTPPNLTTAALTTLLDNESLILSVGQSLPTVPGRQNVIPLSPHLLPEYPEAYLGVSAIFLSTESLAALSPAQTSALLTFADSAPALFIIPTPGLTTPPAFTHLPTASPNALPTIAPRPNIAVTTTTTLPPTPTWLVPTPLTTPRTRPPADLVLVGSSHGYTVQQIPPDRSLTSLRLPTPTQQHTP